MGEKILEFVSQSVTVVGGAGFSKVDLDECLTHAPILIAADGGANNLTKKQYKLDKKYQPEYIIGDLDSLQNLNSWKKKATKLIRIKEQETTDFEKCLYSINAAKYLCVGFIGKRADHFLSVCTNLVKHHFKRIILVGAYDVIFHVPKSFEIHLPVNTRISLFPLQRITGVSDDGLGWSISGITFDPLKRVGISNITTKPKLKLTLSENGMLMILPRYCLRNVLNEVQKF